MRRETTMVGARAGVGVVVLAAWFGFALRRDASMRRGLLHDETNRFWSKGVAAVSLLRLGKSKAAIAKIKPELDLLEAEAAAKGGSISYVGYAETILIPSAQLEKSIKV